jgi:hypothetical protein
MPLSFIRPVNLFQPFTLTTAIIRKDLFPKKDINCRPAQRLSVAGPVIMNVRSAFFVVSILALWAFMSPAHAACVNCGPPTPDYDFSVFSQNGNGGYLSGNWIWVADVSTESSIANVYGSTSMEAFGKVGTIDNFVHHNTDGRSAYFGASGINLGYNPYDGDICNSAAYICGGPIVHDPSMVPYDGDICSPAVYYCGDPIGRDSNTGVTQTPVPATLPLFASGLGILGYLRLRRKSQASAVKAA